MDLSNGKEVEPKDDIAKSQSAESALVKSPKELKKYKSDSYFKVNAKEKKFISHSDEYSDEDNEEIEYTYSKSADYNEGSDSFQHHYPITRSVSDYIPQSQQVQKRIVPLIATSKGRLAAVPQARPKEKHSKSTSIPPSVPSDTLDRDEEDLIVKTHKRGPKSVAFCLCLCDFTAYCSMSIIAPFFPKEASEKGMRETVSGLVFSIYALVVMITAPIFGKLIPIAGAKFLFLFGVALCGISNIVFGLLDYVVHTTSFTVLCFIVRSFEAIGASAFATASCTILIDQFPNDIGTVFGLVETSMGIGMSLGPAIGGALYTVGGFTLPFYVLGTACIFVTPISWFLLRNTKEPNIIVTTDTVSNMKLLSIPHVVVVLLILALASQSLAFIDPTLEPHMRQYDLDVSYVGLLFLLLSGVYGVSAPVVGWLSEKMKNKYPMMIVGLLLITISLMLLGPSEYLPIKGSMELSIVSLTLLGIAVAVAYIPSFESLFIVALNNGLPDDIQTYSVVSGLWNCFYSLGEVTGPALGGALSDFYDFPHAATVIALSTLVMFFISFLAWFNPCKIFGKYSLVAHAADAEINVVSEQIQGSSQETAPLKNSSTISNYGSYSEEEQKIIV